MHFSQKKLCEMIKISKFFLNGLIAIGRDYIVLASWNFINLKLRQAITSGQGSGDRKTIGGAERE